ncbi:hypothetical protein ANCCAN_29614 [Ancylostoma caninum]|uniref:Uncharacterized protein n=1 Tax=Ancylostoma caninum TaxID=29170 RepID=A0A368F177_ANCCA|nr:hypothetical protein ANCCAN_29614 [Ancylostoma caninum]
MINPRSVTFGCFVFFGRVSPAPNSGEYYGSCVYYTVPPPKKGHWWVDPTRLEFPKPKGKPCCEGPQCDEIRKCTFFKNSKCFSHLCYVMIDGVQVRNLQ